MNLDMTLQAMEALKVLREGELSGMLPCCRVEVASRGESLPCGAFLRRAARAWPSNDEDPSQKCGAEETEEAWR